MVMFDFVAVEMLQLFFLVLGGRVLSQGSKAVSSGV